MTRDDIIKLAREACDADKVDAWHNGFWTVTQEELERFAALVAAAEREACARVCETLWDTPTNSMATEEEAYGEKCAAAIRARGEKA